VDLIRTALAAGALASLTVVAASANQSPPTAPPRGTPPAVSQQLDTFAQAWAEVPAYSATVTLFERLDTQVQNSVVTFSFRKPSSATASIISGPNAGAVVTWDGGSTVVARRGTGFAGLFRRTLPVHDPQVTSLRGSSIDQLSFGAMLAHAESGEGTLSEAPTVKLDGEVVDVITLTAYDKATDDGLTREVLELSAVTHLPVCVLGFDGPTLVRRIDFTNVSIGT
jgi:hypothetical protein